MNYRFPMLALALFCAPFAAASETPAVPYAVSVTQDAVYGEGAVTTPGGKLTERALKMDVYRPARDGKLLTDRPAVVMMFGGAFHRGSKGAENFEEDGASDSSMADYCTRFARAGYVCTAIEYRLAPENPQLTHQPDPGHLMPREMMTGPAATGRVELVRQRMGLPPLDDASRDALWRSYLAASEDLVTAVHHLRGHAKKWGVAPDRIAIGGFSAGAISVVNAAYGMGAPVRGAIMLSGGFGAYDLRQTVQGDMPPALFFLGQNDLGGIMAGTRAAIGVLKAADVPVESAWVPGFGHFYPMGAVSLGSDMSRATVERRILDFLDRTIGEEAEGKGAR
ncbi:alpha/beta hydrolase [Sphingopyxis sp. MWB1]|uniref:alpha/beta hydrolase n=1 Tax=Sphingopyxis sp. MWB1 TaxID=1537715 RepID=UPI000A77B98A|nr:alpha/beta hydrolase [Sphingopyxis sp. MWB1]